MVSPKLTFNEGSTYWSYKPGTQGYTFVSSAIDSARAAGIPFVVVAMHMYCLSLVDYPCASSPDLMNLLFQKKVDVYLQAHDHGYARSKQLALSSSCTVDQGRRVQPRLRRGREPHVDVRGRRGDRARHRRLGRPLAEQGEPEQDRGALLPEPTWAPTTTRPTGS